MVCWSQIQEFLMKAKLPHISLLLALTLPALPVFATEETSTNSQPAASITGTTTKFQKEMGDLVARIQAKINEGHRAEERLAPGTVGQVSLDARTLDRREPVVEPGGGLLGIDARVGRLEGRRIPPGLSQQAVDRRVPFAVIAHLVCSS